MNIDTYHWLWPFSICLAMVAAIAGALILATRDSLDIRDNSGARTDYGLALSNVLAKATVVVSGDDSLVVLSQKTWEVISYRHAYSFRPREADGLVISVMAYGRGGIAEAVSAKEDFLSLANGLHPPLLIPPHLVVSQLAYHAESVYGPGLAEIQVRIENMWSKGGIRTFEERQREFDKDVGERLLESKEE